MKKTIILTLMCLQTLSSDAQVYLSKVYNDILILGPNNVAPHCDEIAYSYIGEIENLYDILIKEQDALHSAVAALQQLSKPTKGQLFTLDEQQGDIDLIEQELTILMQFKELWLHVIDQTPVKLDLVDAIRSGQCSILKTNHGSFTTNEFMVTIDKDVTNIKVVEHFKVEHRDSIPKWITKIDENCASKDPNDCKVWCFLNEKGGKVLVDYTGDIYRLEDSLLGNQFDMNATTQSASRTLSINLEGSTIDIINVVKSDTNMLLQLDGFSTVVCKE